MPKKNAPSINVKNTQFDEFYSYPEIKNYDDLYFKESFSDCHPLLCAFGAGVLFLAALVGLGMLYSVVCPPKDYKAEQDAAARCRSLDGNFSHGNLKCYINGQEV